MIVERGGQIRLQQSKLGPGTVLDLEAATIRDGGEILFAWSAFADGSGVSLTGVHVDGGRIHLDSVSVEAGAHILVDHARLKTAESPVLTDMRMNDRAGFSIGGAHIVDRAVDPSDFFSRAS